MTKRYFRLLSAFLFLLSGHASVAQVENATLQRETIADTTVTIPSGNYPALTYGIRGGVNFAQFNVNGGDLRTANSLRDDQANHVRVQAGLVSNYALNENLSLQAELLFSQKGAEYKGVKPVNKALQEYKDQTILNYLEIPVLVKVSAPVYGDSLRFFVNAGPSVSYLLNGTYKSKSLHVESKEKIPFSYGDEGMKFNRFDASVHAGAGFELLTGIGKIAVEGRAVFGLLNVMDVKAGDASAYPAVYNRSLGLYLTYFLPDFF